MTTTELGARLGLTASTVERMERGEYPPKKATMIAVAVVLGLDVATFVNGCDDDARTR